MFATRKGRRAHLRAGLATVLLVCIGAGVAHAGAVSGTVVSPTGQPVEGAEVIAATVDLSAWPNVPLAERKAEPDRYGTPATATTGPGGRFTFDLPADAGLLSVHHETGYAEVSPSELSKDAPIKLEPWCEVRGVAKVGNKPLAGVEVHLGNFPYSNNAARIYYGYRTVTDAEGRYALKRVPAGLACVTLWNKPGESRLERYTGAEPGKPATLDLGGAGRPVVGKLVLGGNLDLKNVDNRAVKDRLHLNTMFRLDVPYPEPSGRAPGDQFPGETGQQREDAERAWRRTPEAVAVHARQYRHDPRIGKDGSFRLEDVPPGTYKLFINVSQLAESRTYEDAGSVQKTVVVPDPGVLPSDEVFDVGELTIGGEGL